MKTVILDFDGTIVDSFDYVISFLTQAARRPAMSEAEKQQFKGLSMAAMARRLRHPLWRLPFLFWKGRRVMGSAVAELPFFKGMQEVLEWLHQKDYQLFIVTSNASGNVQKALEIHEVADYFTTIYGGIGMFGKAPVLRKMLRTYALKPEDCIYIGDEARDIEASQAVGLRCVAVTWGFADPEFLRRHKPAAVVNKPQELPQLIRELLGGA